jgi:hypothetical protein
MISKTQGEHNESDLPPKADIRADIAYQRQDEASRTASITLSKYRQTRRRLGRVPQGTVSLAFGFAQRKSNLASFDRTMPRPKHTCKPALSFDLSLASAVDVNRIGVSSGNFFQFRGGTSISMMDGTLR